MVFCYLPNKITPWSSRRAGTRSSVDGRVSRLIFHIQATPLTSFADALAAYERKQKDDPQSVELTLGRMRCLHALGEWERLAQLSLETWKAANGMDQ